MGGRHFDQRNRKPPACLTAMADRVPACFDRKVWVLYLDDCWRGVLNDKAERDHIRRGQTPNYCEECTQGHRAKMLAAGRCQPPNQPNDAALTPPGRLSPPGREAGGLSIEPSSQEVVGEHEYRLDPAARAAASISAGLSGPDVKMLPLGLAFADARPSNAQSRFATPPVNTPPAGLCEGVDRAA